MNACYMRSVRDYGFLGQVLTLTQQPHAPVHHIYIGELRNYTHSSCLQLPVQPHTGDLSASMQFGSWRGTCQSVSDYSASYCAKSKGHSPVSASEGWRGTCASLAAQAAELRQQMGQLYREQDLAWKVCHQPWIRLSKLPVQSVGLVPDTIFFVVLPLLLLPCVACYPLLPAHHKYCADMKSRV